MAIWNILFWATYFIGLYLIIFWLLVYLDHSTEDRRRRLRRYRTVSIVIPAYNEEKNILGTVESALQLRYPKKDLRVVVVDDGSKDNTKRIVERYIKEHPGEHLQLIHQENGGKGKALNNALRRITTELFICLDADSFVEPSALQHIVPYFDDDRVAVVLPRLKVAEATTFVQKIQWFEYTMTFFLKKLMGAIDCVYVAPGPFSVYRAAYLRKIGGFDEHNLTEDLEIAVRFQKHDYKLVQLMHTLVYTKAPRTFKALYTQRNRWYKGGLFNLIKYKDMIFNRKYGEFGLLQVPMMWIAVFLSTVVFVSIWWKNLFSPALEKLRNWSFINYDLAFSWKDFADKFSFLNPDYFELFLIYAAFAVSLLYACIAFRSSREKMFRRGLATPVFYFFFYPPLIVLIWIGILFDLLRGKRQKW